MTERSYQSQGDPDSKPRPVTWRHVHTDENLSKCDGRALVEFTYQGRALYTKIAQCDLPHDHRVYEQVWSDGSVQKPDIRELGAIRYLPTLTEARAHADAYERQMARRMSNTSSDGSPLGTKAAIKALVDHRAKHGHDSKGMLHLGSILPAMAQAIRAVGGPMPQIDHQDAGTTPGNDATGEGNTQGQNRGLVPHRPSWSA